MEKIYEVRTVLGEYLGTLDVCESEADALQFARWYYKCEDIKVKDITDEYED